MPEARRKNILTCILSLSQKTREHPGPLPLELVGDNDFRLFVKEVSLVHIEVESDLAACSCGCVRIYAGSDLSSAKCEVQEYFGTEKLVYVDGGSHCAVFVIGDVLRTDTHNNCFADIAFFL